MAYTDRTLTCADCKAAFTFSASEQEFFASKGFESDPSRCPECREARKRNRSESGFRGGSQRGYDREQRQMHDAVCAECGKNTQVPFVPSGSRPVFCSDCFHQQRGTRSDRSFNRASR